MYNQRVECKRGETEARNRVRVCVYVYMLKEFVCMNTNVMRQLYLSLQSLFRVFYTYIYLYVYVLVCRVFFFAVVPFIFCVIINVAVAVAVVVDDNDGMVMVVGISFSGDE